MQKKKMSFSSATFIKSFYIYKQNTLASTFKLFGLEI